MLRVSAEQSGTAGEVAALLTSNGGNSSGVGIASIGPRGGVHADQFSHHRSFGNVTEKPFGQIWEEALDPVLAGLKSRPRPLAGRCSTCPALPICNGNLRVRAESYSDDVWAPDPACYLSDQELQEVGEVLSRG
jgi:radical SAM protein with 4Fe4S-binding SPASM domain